MSTSLLFRADAGPETGSGHVMRCIALAQACIAEGMDMKDVEISSQRVEGGRDGVAQGIGVLAGERGRPAQANATMMFRRHGPRVGMSAVHGDFVSALHQPRGQLFDDPFDATHAGRNTLGAEHRHLEGATEIRRHSP